MAQLVITTAKAVTPSAANTTLGVRAWLDGTLANLPWIEALTLEGRVFTANVGITTTPVAMSAAGIVLTAPSLTQVVPVGTTILPLEIAFYAEVIGTSAQVEMMAMSGKGGAVGSGGAAANYIANHRSDSPIANTTTIRGGADTSATALTTNINEFWRDGQQFGITKTSMSATVSSLDVNKWWWRRPDRGTGPVLVGDGTAQLMAYFTAQALTGFISYTFVQIPSY